MLCKRGIGRTAVLAIAMAMAMGAVPAYAISSPLDDVATSVQNLPAKLPELPDPPQAPAKAPAKPVAEQSPTGSSPQLPSGPAGGSEKVVGSVVDTVAGAASKATGVTAGAPKEVAKQTEAAKSTPRAPGPASVNNVNSQGDVGAGPPDAAASGSAADARPPAPATLNRFTAGVPASVKRARAAPLRRWLAYVWPAIALDGGPAALARLEAASLPPVSISEAARLLFAQAAHASGEGAPGPSAHPITAAEPPPRSDPDPAFVPEGREITFFVIFSFAALLAFLLSTIWVEVRSKYLYR